MALFAAPHKEEEEKKRKRRGLLPVIFDILQTGNYMSANVVNSITDSAKSGAPLGDAAMDAIRAAMRGLTWKEKNTFSDVIRQNAEEHGKFFGRTLEEWTQEDRDISKGETKVGRLINTIQDTMDTPADRWGLAGDIALDPLTYISPLKAIMPGGMATPGARAAAGKAATDATKIRALGSNIDMFKGAARRGSGGIGDILKKGGRSAARDTEDFFSQAYKQSLRGDPGVLQSQMREGFQQALENPNTKKAISEHMQKTIDEMQELGIPMEQVGLPSGMQDLAKSIELGYGGAGERGMRMLGRERFKGVRDPNFMARGIEALTKRIGDNPAGSKLADAWSSWVNGNSIVGGLRRILGVRNPYQQHLNLIKNQAKGLREEVIARYADHAQAAFKDLGEDMTEKATGIRGILEQVEFGSGKQSELSRGSLQAVVGDATGKGGVYTTQDALRALENGNIDQTIKVLKERGLNTKVFDDIKALGISNEDAQKIGEFWTDMDKMFKDMRDVETALINEDVFKKDAMGEWINYIPKARNQPNLARRRAGKLTGPSAPGFMEQTKTTFRQSERQGIELAKEFFGDWIEDTAKNTGRAIDDVAREFVEKGNLAPVSTNLVEMVNARILAHSRAVSRGSMIKQLSSFGVRMDELSGMAGDAVNRMGGIFNELVKVSDDSPLMQGMLFDKDVADIVDKTFAMTASDDALSGVMRGIANMTTWWKGLATATTGFHMRNFFSNNVTGIFRHGGQWLNARKHFDSMVATYYALHPTKYIDMLKKDFLEINEGMIQSVLGKEVGGKSIKYWADKAREDGIISLKTMIGDVSKEVKPKVSIGKRVNPFKQDFAPVAGSRAVGTAIENQARFNSYLLTIEDLSKSGVASDAIEEFAKLDTKKWFIDYGDLSEAEQKYFKKIIPFYTWLRKNLANQISGLMVMPDAYRVAAKMEDAVTLDDFDYSLIPDYMKKAGYLPIGEGEKGPTMWWPNLPYGDLNKIPLFFEDGVVPKLDAKEFADEIKEEFGSSVNPIIKTVMQSLSGQNMFRKREYLDQVPAPIGQVFARQPKIIAAIDNIMKRMGFENGAGIRERDGKVVIDEGFEQIMSNNIPAIRTLARLFDAGVDISGLEEVVENLTGRQDPYEGMEDLFQNIAVLGGLKFKENDNAWQQELMQRAIEEAAQKDRNKWKRSLPGYSQRAAAYGARRDAQRRRIGL
jgi:hypothetical protein